MGERRGAAIRIGHLRKEYGNCDYDVRQNISAFDLYQIPFHSEHAVLREVLGGWAFAHEGILAVPGSGLGSQGSYAS